MRDSARPSAPDPASRPPAPPPDTPWPPLFWALWLALVVGVALLTWHQKAALLIGPRLVATMLRAALAGAAGILLATWLELQLGSRSG